jgi:hypothetical protein
MKEIKLTKGKVALVDDQDFEWLSKWRWKAVKGGRKTISFYAMRTAYKCSISMHRAILNITNPSLKTDHIDRNGLNNQRHNLRIATARQNSQNESLQPGCSSLYKGVSFYKATERWRAYIRIPNIKGRGNSLHLGYFKNEIDAAKAYDEAAIKYHLEFASLNFPRLSE